MEGLRDELLFTQQFRVCKILPHTFSLLTCRATLKGRAGIIGDLLQGREMKRDPIQHHGTCKQQNENSNPSWEYFPLYLWTFDL